MAGTVKMDNRKAAVAARLARFAAKMGSAVTSCPYTGDEPEEQALRRVWLSTFLRLRPPAAGSVEYGAKAAVKAAAQDPVQDDRQDQRDWDDARAALLAAWPVIVGPLVGWLAAETSRVTAAGDLAGLAGITPPADVVDGVTSAVTDAAVTLAATTAGRVADDATVQGVTVDLPDRPGAADATATATVLTGLVVGAYTAAAARAAINSGSDVAGKVTTVLTGMGAAATGTVADNLGAVLTAAQHAGRVAALTAAPAAVRYVAVERDDKNRCPACAAADGREYPTLADALVDYPTAGNRACAGGLRCRGRITPIWN